MKEALVGRGPSVQIIDSPLPSPGPGEVLIKVVVSGSNPKDWKMPEYYVSTPFNSGDDIAGIVHEIGTGVTEFKPGDRVASMHKIGHPGGSYAEYGVGQVGTTFHIPDSVSFEEAATIPLAALTAAVLLFRGLGIPEPWAANTHRTEKTPLVVYGGASAVGAFAIQLAKRSRLSPIIAIAGRGSSFVKSLLDEEKGDTVIDYRAGDQAVVDGIRAALQGLTLRYAFDAVRTNTSYVNLAKLLHSDPTGIHMSKLALVLPLPGLREGTAGRKAESLEPYQMPPGVQPIFLGVNLVYSDNAQDSDFGYVYSRYLAKGLSDGWLKPHPHEVQPKGLGSLQDALKNLKDGKASAVKYVFRIDDTPGIKG